MLASVTRLPSRLGSFPEALVAFRAARFQSCLSHLHGVESVAAKILRARTSLRLGDPESALTALTGIEGDEGRDRAELVLLLAVAHSRLGDEDRADSLLRDAYVYGVSATDLALEAEVEYYRALMALGEGDLPRAREACRRGLEVATSPTRSTQSEGVVPLGHVVARTYELLGIVDAAEGRYQDLIQNVRLALATLDRCVLPDVFQEAFALKNLAIVARDFDITDDAQLLSTRVPALAWTEDVCRVEFTTVEALGWCSALRGDSVGALRLFRRAGSTASTVPERIIIGVDRALLAREFGHRAMVIEEVEHAISTAYKFDWEKAPDDSRDALLFLAQAAAAIAPINAREMIDRYTAIRNSMDVTFAARLEPRARAEEAYTQGLVLRAEGRLTASAERLQAAFETWESIGYEWRAARAALELAELNAGDVFRLAVRRELIQRPDSVFSGRARLVA